MEKNEYKVAIRTEYKKDSIDLYVMGYSIPEAIRNALDESNKDGFTFADEKWEVVSVNDRPAFVESDVMEVLKIQRVKVNKTESNPKTIKKLKTYQINYTYNNNDDVIITGSYDIMDDSILLAYEHFIEFGPKLPKLEVVSIVEANEFTEAPVVDIKKLVEEGERL